MKNNRSPETLLPICFLICILALSVCSACHSRESEISGMQGIAYYYYAEKSHEGSGGKIITERQHLLVIAKDAGTILPQGTVAIIDTELMDSKIKDELQNYTSGEKILFNFIKVGESDPVVITPVYLRKTSTAAEITLDEAETHLKRYGYKVVR